MEERLNKNNKILVLGASGLAGSAICRELERRGYENVLTPSSKRPDLRNYENTFKLFFNVLPDYVFNCAAHSGGILEAIDKPAEMLYDNLMIQTNVIEMCKKAKVKKLINLASSCIYPVNGKQPYKEEQIGEGKTDENWSYAVAKIAGIELCRSYYKQYGCNFMTVVPCNLVGLQSMKNFENAHVVPALIDKIYKAKKRMKGNIEVWGNGFIRREFLDSDDLGFICVSMMKKYNYNDLYDGVVNVGTGPEVQIDELVDMVKNVVGYYPNTRYNSCMPQGVKSKLLDISRMEELGFKAKTEIYKSVKKEYEGYFECQKLEN